MTAPFNGMSPAEAERLAMLAEEAGEIVQAVGKVLRHGYESRSPEGGPTNRQHLYRELGDLIAIVHGMMWAGDIVEIVELTDAADRWEAKLRYTHHQADEEGCPATACTWADRYRAAFTRAAGAVHHPRRASRAGHPGGRYLAAAAILAGCFACARAVVVRAPQDRSTLP